MNRNIALTEWDLAGDKVINEDIFSMARHGKLHEIQDFFRGGIDPDSIDKQGNTILIIACQNNRKNIVKLCLQYKADVNWKNNYGKTGLDFALLYKYTRLEEYLRRKGAE